MKWLAYGLAGFAVLLCLGIVVLRGRGERFSGKTSDVRITLAEPDRPGAINNRPGSSGSRTNGSADGLQDPEDSYRVGPDGTFLGPDGLPYDPTNGTIAYSGIVSPDGSTTSTLGLPGAPGSPVRLGPDGRPILTAGDASDGGATSAAPGEKNSDTATGTDDDPLDEEPDETPGPGAAGVYGSVLRGTNAYQGALLRLSREDGSDLIERVTGPDGLYRFEGLNVGMYILYLIEPKSPNNLRTFQIRESDQWVEQDFVVSDLPPVTGRILDDESGKGIADATVVATRLGNHMGQVQSQTDGSYSMVPLEPGEYTLLVTAKGYLKGEKNFELRDSDTSTKTIDVALKAAPLIRGIVYTPDGIPASGALASLFGNAGLWNDPYEQSGWETTDSAGRFAFAIPDPDMTMSFQVGAMFEEYLPAYSAIQTPGTPDAEIVVQLARGATLTGRIVDTDGYAVPDATVAVTGGFSTTRSIYRRFTAPLPQDTTDADGRFSIRPIEPGDVEITVSADGYIQGQFEFSVSGANLGTGDLEIESTDEKKAGRIFGVVVDENFTLISGTGVYLRRVDGPETAYAQTDDRGGFRFDDMPEGDYVISLSGSMLRGSLWIPASYVYPFVRAGDERIYLVYDLGHSVELRVEDSFGEPFTDFKVGIQVDDYGPVGHGGEREHISMSYQRNVQTADGNIVLDNLISGVAAISVSVADVGTGELSNISVPVSTTGDAGTVVITAGSVLEGIVVATEDGDRLKGVEVRAVPPAGSPPDHPLNTIEFRAWTDDSGFFRLTGLPRGEANLTFRATSRLALRLPNLNLEANKTLNLGTIQLDAGAILVGVARNPDGQGIDDVLVNIATHTLYGDAMGRFRGDFLPEGTHILEIVDQRHRYVTQRLDINLVAGEETPVAITMEPRTP